MSDDEEIEWLPMRSVPIKGKVTPEKVYEVAQCQDCVADVILMGPDENDWYQAIVSHDETCPYFAQRRRETDG